MHIHKLRNYKYYAVSFWFLALFPGRIGYDNIQALDTIRNGQSTDWWTAQYFWLLKISSFGGNAVFFTSFLSLIIGVYSVNQFIVAFQLSKRTSETTLLILCVFPLLPVFMLTISHDAFACSGLVLLVSLLVNKSLLRQDLSRRQLFDFSLSFLLLTTTFSGQLIALVALVAFLVTHRNLKSATLSLSILVVFFASFAGVTKVIPSEKYLWPMIADIKCVVQHPDAEIHQDLWKLLETLGPIDQWKEPVSCNKMDYAAAIIYQGALSKVDKVSFVRQYLEVAVSNPQIVIVSHLQKTQGVFPPPFFQPPENMISWNSQEPVGKGSDSSLQTQAEVLHISIDSEQYKYSNPILRFFEAIALLPVFFINQASWFWGWSGFWFIFLAAGGVRFYGRGGVFHLLPVLFLMTILFVTSPAPSARYSMGITIMGFTSFLLICFDSIFDRKIFPRADPINRKT